MPIHVECTFMQVEFNIKSMAHLYSKGVPLLVYFTEHRLQDSEIDQLSVQFQNKEYPSVWMLVIGRSL